MMLSPILPLWLIIAMGVAAIVLCTLRIVLERPSRKARWCRRLALSAILIVIALRPMLPFGSNLSISTDINAVFIVDATGSMAAEDHGDNNQPRLDGARADVKALAADLAGARFSLIAFDNTPYLALPLTSDANALAAAVDALSPIYSVYSSGSDISSPLSTAEDIIKANIEKYPNRRTVLYYLGDGELTSNHSISIPSGLTGLIIGGAVLGYGTTEGSPVKDTYYTHNIYDITIPNNDWIYLRDANYEKAISKIDETNLKKIAADLRIAYYHRTDFSSTGTITNQVKQNIDKTSQRDLSVYTDIYWILAIIFMGLLFWELNDILKYAVMRRGNGG